MRRWLSSITKKIGDSDQQSATDGVFEQLELLVIKGEDIGQRFTLDGEEMTIGRSVPNDNQKQSISLRDNTVSARQAVVTRKPDGVYLDHVDSATNLTLVDGETAIDCKLEVGCRIEIGRVVLSVKDSGRKARRTTVQVSEDSSAEVDADDRTRPSVVPRREVSSTDATLSRVTPPVTVGYMQVISGETIIGANQFVVEARPMTIGRSDNSDIQIMDGDVSRAHAQVIFEGGQVILIHRSKTNSTLVNDKVVIDRVALHDGDIITLTEHIALQFTVDADGTADRVSEAINVANTGSLQEVMESKVKIDQTIEERYTVEGSFLDVDIVDSYGMKVGDISPEHTIISFERFRTFVGDIVNEHDGQLLNSNGDELMCFFSAPYDAVRAADQILVRLEAFNEERNMLARPFRVRIGVHSGKSLVDLERGVAYSSVLDVAGHLQKATEPNTVVISEATLESIPEGLPFKAAGTLKRGVSYFVMEGHLP